MESRLDTLIDLLHRCADGALATHSLAVPGYPFATAVPYAPDERHRPVFLISGLAEHTQNLAADSRASFLVWRPLGDGEMVRATLVGNMERFAAEPLLVDRFLRYQPEMERLLAFGDFAFFRLQPERIRIIGGFAQAGWLEGARIAVPPSLTFAAERDLLASLGPCPDCDILGIDPFGIDLRRPSGRDRRVFADGPVPPEQLAERAKRDLFCG